MTVDDKCKITVISRRFSIVSEMTLSSGTSKPIKYIPYVYDSKSEEVL